MVHKCMRAISTNDTVKQRETRTGAIKAHRTDQILWIFLKKFKCHLHVLKTSEEESPCDLTRPQWSFPSAAAAAKIRLLRSIKLGAFVTSSTFRRRFTLDYGGTKCLSGLKTLLTCSNRKQDASEWKLVQIFIFPGELVQVATPSLTCTFWNISCD